MLTVGLTGGIGSGKSTVSRLLVARGAFLVDADEVAREVVAPGSPGLARVVSAFGAWVLAPDGSLDRPALGRLVFADRQALAQLNAILHPLIQERTDALLAAADATIVVHDIALLVENDLAGRYDAVVVVDAEPRTQLQRLVRLRGMSEQEALDRIAAQASREQRLAVATHVLHNDGPRALLLAQVDELWRGLLLEAADRPGPRRRSGP